MKLFTPVILSLLLASTAHAQVDDGQRARPAASDTSSKRSEAPKPNKTEIVGVVTGIDPAADRVTVACEETDALNLPAGERSFIASKHELLKGVTVGEKIRFSLDSQQISSLRPFRVDEAQ
jgi:Cu/Ag efflux protein CusF